MPTFAMTASVGPSPEPNAKPVRTAGNSVRPSYETNCSEFDDRETRQGFHNGQNLNAAGRHSQGVPPAGNTDARTIL